MKKQRGDTIIEVMLSLAIVGMSLGIAYAITNRSLATGRAAQERIEAVKLAESQLEGLKSVYSSTTKSTYEVPTEYCLIDAVKIDIPSTPPAPSCNNYGSGSLYNLQLKYNSAVGADPAYFESIVTWQLPNSTSDGEVKLRYRP